MHRGAVRIGDTLGERPAILQEMQNSHGRGEKDIAVQVAQNPYVSAKEIQEPGASDGRLLQLSVEVAPHQNQ